MTTELELVVDFANKVREKGICWACANTKCEDKSGEAAACVAFERIAVLKA